MKNKNGRIGTMSCIRNDMKDKIVAQGEKIYLRELVEDDVTDRYLSWFRDPQVTEFLEARNLTSKDVIDYIRAGKETATYYMFAICSNESGLHVGNLKVGPIERKHMLSDLVTVIGDKNYWGIGLATEAIMLGNELAFSHYGIRKLSAGMYADNIRSIKAYTKAGWVIEAILQGHYLLNGKILDRICVACFNPKYFDLSKIKVIQR